MKQFLGAGLLLFLFLMISLSFCVLEFGINENPEASDATVHYAKDETGKLGKVHVTFSERLIHTVSEVFSSIRSAAKALPFFAVDMAKEVYKEAKEVFVLFGRVLSDPSSKGAVWV